jgi:hypothetical protein
MMTGLPPSITAAAEFEVPRSIPITLPIIQLSFLILKLVDSEEKAFNYFAAARWLPKECATSNEPLLQRYRRIDDFESKQA